MVFFRFFGVFFRVFFGYFLGYNSGISRQRDYSSFIMKNAESPLFTMSNLCIFLPSFQRAGGRGHHVCTILVTSSKKSILVKTWSPFRRKVNEGGFRDDCHGNLDE